MEQRTSSGCSGLFSELAALLPEAVCNNRIPNVLDDIVKMQCDLPAAASGPVGANHMTEARHSLRGVGELELDEDMLLAAALLSKDAKQPGGREIQGLPLQGPVARGRVPTGTGETDGHR